MTKEKYALLDTDFISKTHLIRKDDQNKMIDRIMEMQGYQFFCHEQIKIELKRHNIGNSPAWLEAKIIDGCYTRNGKEKKYRSLKISSIWNYGSNPSPQLRLQGRWLEELGFQIGEAVLVKCEDGKLIITPDAMRAKTESRDKATKKRYGRAWKRIRDKYAAEHPFCELCFDRGIIVPTEEIHHKKPLSEGGTHDRSNLIALCKSCHSTIHAKRGDYWGRTMSSGHRSCADRSGAETHRG